MKRWKSSRIVVCFLFLAFIIAKCMNTEHSSTSNESSFKNEKNEVSRWYSQTPKTILSDADAKNDVTTQLPHGGFFNFTSFLCLLFVNTE
ncbi:hypothetical protein, partial [Bacillus thuringiensis]|uniref:hypothetical protein n=1 Tax=Bacillus thuringiensis TaxID=1428 RepID=UPI002E1952E2|nr:hypothetical protein [Bacillus thuringiensis]